MRIALGADNLGYPLKETVKAHLIALGHDVIDYGAFDTAPTDYPDIAVTVARDIADGTVPRAILFCGTGIGMAMTANKVAGVRAASVSDPYSAERARKSNDAQVLCLGALVVGSSVATVLIDIWLAAEFQGGASARKVGKMKALDEHRPVRPSVQP